MIDDGVRDDLDGEAVWDAVQRDVEEGLGQFFQVDEVAFVGPTTRADGLFTNPSGSFAVAWRCSCTDNKEFPDLVPSFRSFHVDGVSMVRQVDGAWEYRRLIDWNAAVCALGESRHRRSVRTEGAHAYFDSQAPGRRQ